MLTLTCASVESAFVKIDIDLHSFEYFSQWLPIFLQVKQRSSCCNLVSSSQVSLITSLQARRVEAGFDTTEKRRLYRELTG